MSQILPLCREDLPEVASLYEHVLRSGSRVPAPGLIDYMRWKLLDYPGADPSIPSFTVREKSGAVVGFVGIQVRRYRMDDRPVKISFLGQLVAEPSARGTTGARLLHAAVSAPADAVIVQYTNFAPRWSAVAPFEDTMITWHFGSITWTRILRPVPFGLDYVGRHLSKGAGIHLRTKRRVGPGIKLPRLLASLRPERSPFTAEELTPWNLLEHLPMVARSRRLCPDYDEAFLKRVFEEMTPAGSDSLVKALVKDGKGRVLGWYIYLLNRGGRGKVMQVAAVEGRAGDVLDHLLHDAYSRGAASLRGSVDASLFTPLSRRRALFRHKPVAVVLSHAADILLSLLSGNALVHPMDGELWSESAVSSRRWLTPGLIDGPPTRTRLAEPSPYETVGNE